MLGNKAASGTVIIKELGEEHIRTGRPIVYTSADPVFQIAAHEDVVPIETLYAWCEAAFELCVPRGMSRVIARPFVGDFPDFTRTHRRKDYALEPPRPTFLDDLERSRRARRSGSARFRRSTPRRGSPTVSTPRATQTASARRWTR